VSDYKWIDRAGALAAHTEQLAQHGGPEGVRDNGALESALARPLNLGVYGEPDAAALAAAYAFGIARNHPFVDGNKRTAAVVSVGFLFLNGFGFRAIEADLALTFQALAAGELGEEQMADWFRQHIVPA
jgi:death-on-curing protein